MKLFALDLVHVADVVDRFIKEDAVNPTNFSREAITSCKQFVEMVYAVYDAGYAQAKYDNR